MAFTSRRARLTPPHAARIPRSLSRHRLLYLPERPPRRLVQPRRPRSRTHPPPQVGGLACGWAKLQEFHSYLAEFRESGKFSIAYLEVGGEKEYFAASACEEMYTPPGAYISLRGLSVGGTFLRGVFEKVGIEPQIKRIGKYKSAGDQLGRKDMSDAQREVLNALLEQIFDNWVKTVAKGRGKTEEDVLALLDDPAGVFDMQKLKQGGWITDTKYLVRFGGDLLSSACSEPPCYVHMLVTPTCARQLTTSRIVRSFPAQDELNKMLKKRTGGAENELRFVTLSRYNRTRPQSLGLDVGVPSIAVVRAAGSISRGGGGNGIQNEDFIRQIKRIQKDRRAAGAGLPFLQHSLVNHHSIEHVFRHVLVGTLSCRASLPSSGASRR